MTTDKHIEELQVALNFGFDVAQAVLDNWESGDLATAVRNLEDWIVNNAELVPENIEDKKLTIQLPKDFFD